MHACMHCQTGLKHITKEAFDQDSSRGAKLVCQLSRLDVKVL